MDTGRIAYKYRLLPDEAQREYLSRCFGCVRFVYNRYVEFCLSECGCVMDRDHNAACNLRDWFLGHAAEIYNTAGTAGIDACGDSASTPGLRPEASGVVETGSPFLRQ